MTITIETVAMGAKLLGGLTGGLAMTEFAEASAEMVFQYSTKEALKNPTMRKIIIKGVGITAGVITSACISKKIDDVEAFAKAVEKAYKELQEESNKK